MIRHKERYTFMRKNIFTGKIEEGISSDDMKVMDNLMRAAVVEDVTWVCWVRENKVGITRYEDVLYG